MKLKKVWPQLTTAPQTLWDIWVLNLSLTPLLLNLFCLSVNWGQKYPYSSYCLPSPVGVLGVLPGAPCDSGLVQEQRGDGPPQSRVHLGSRCKGPARLTFRELGILKLPKETGTKGCSDPF